MPGAVSIDFNQLRHFLAVADTLHFGRAAQALSMPQPHLSRSIARLEAEIGVLLIERTSRRANLTAAGVVFREEALALLQARERLVAVSRKAMSDGARVLRIAFVSAALYEVLPRLVRALRSLERPIGVELQEATSNEQIDLLGAGRIDLGLVHPPIASRDRATTLTLGSDRFDAVVPADHPLSARTSIAFDRLAGEPFVLFPEDQGPVLFAAIRDQCRVAGHQLAVAATASRIHSQLCLVSAGLGVGLAPRHSRSLSVDGTVRIPIEPYPATLTWDLATLWDARMRSEERSAALDILRSL